MIKSKVGTVTEDLLAVVRNESTLDSKVKTLPILLQCPCESLSPSPSRQAPAANHCNLFMLQITVIYSWIL